MKSFIQEQGKKDEAVKAEQEEEKKKESALGGEKTDERTNEERIEVVCLTFIVYGENNIIVMLWNNILYHMRGYQMMSVRVRHKITLVGRVKCEMLRYHIHISLPS